jgi:chorismate mutase
MNKLDFFRCQIDKTDNQIINLLAKRLSIVKKIGVYKKKHQLSALDRKRFESMLKSRVCWGKKQNLSPTFIKKIFCLIHQFSLLIEF